MEQEFEFDVTEESAQFCEKIIEEMENLFNINREEALEKMNELWADSDFKDASDDRFHEEVTYWAKTIYYGPDFIWWDNEPEDLEL